MEEWKEYKLGDVVNILDYKRVPLSSKERSTRKGHYPYYGAQGIIDYIDDYIFDGTYLLIAEDGENLKSQKQNVAQLASGKYWVNNHAHIVESNGKSDIRFICYFLNMMDLSGYITGSAQPKLNQANLTSISLQLPSLRIQKKIADFLSVFDDKIEVNRRINDNFYYAFYEVMLIWLLTSLENDNLEKQAQTIFDSMFPSITSGEDEIGSIITPKRGKGLLSKDAVDGDVPVIAGGLEPATFHNEANTKAPVVTISASGANAGFVNLWQIPVWSSDSSFIDSTMTEDVYFWYVMLRKRQKEIFDAQTGSAQPHIYPKHIAEMPLGKFEQTDVEKFTEIVTPMFEIRGRNLKESERLASIRDTLLPKLMSGELKLENINM